MEKKSKLKSKPKLTLSEISLHGCVNPPNKLKDDGQNINSLFKVPKNVTIMFRGGFGFAQYTIPGVIDTIMGRDSDKEPLSMMLKRHNDKFNNFGSLCLYNEGSRCINLALQDESKEYDSGRDTSFVITVNEGEQISDVDVKWRSKSEKLDDIHTITSICGDRELMKYYHTLSKMRSSFCKAAQKIEQGFRYIYLEEVVNMLMNVYQVSDTNKLVIYVSSCQVVDEEWMEAPKLLFKNVIDTSLEGHDLALKVFNPDDLSPEERGFSEKEMEFLSESLLDFKDQFYGTSIEGYLDIPDRRSVFFQAWYSSLFPESKGVKRKKSARLKKKKSKRKKKKSKRKKY